MYGFADNGLFFGILVIKLSVLTYNKFELLFSSFSLADDGLEIRLAEDIVDIDLLIGDEYVEDLPFFGLICIS